MTARATFRDRDLERAISAAKRAGKPAKPLRMTHWSAKPLGDLRWEYQQLPMPRPKPCGFWLSDERRGQFGWRKWCHGEQWNLGGFAHRQAFFVDTSKVLWLRSSKDLDEFSAQNGDDHGYIDWGPVAQKWSGILITPYQWERRLCLHTEWYYGWDCASACIWRPDAIQRETQP